MNRWLCGGLVLFSIIFNQSVWAICDAEFNAAMDTNLKVSGGGYSGSIRRNQQDWSSGKDLPTGSDKNLLENIEGLKKARAQAYVQKDGPLAILEITGRIQLNEHTLCWLRNKQGDSSAFSGNTNNQSPQQPDQANQAQQQSQQAQQQARQNQARADQARQGKRRRHEPENEASHCIQPDFGGLYGGMKNTCSFKVWYTYCGYRPKESSWLTGMNCEKQSFGSDSVSPGRTSASHTKGVEMLYWIACKEPAWTVDTEFVPGQGLRGRCHTVGGN
jgi:hypothetical protein